MSERPPDSAAPSCARDPIEPAVVEPTDRLHVPRRKRMWHAYVTSETGERELCLYYENKEVTFDEERLFPFGERLARESSFVAESATSWGPGYEWPEIRSMLEALLDEGLLRRGEAAEEPRGGHLVPSPLPPSLCPVPRMWSAGECESITRDLAGRPVEIGYIEAFLAVYRIAHPALDADGRQVGEANVYPAGLRLDRETEWRACQYPGSRYQADAPMNVTALKAMIAHWKPMMATILEVRAELVGRLERARDGWTVGDLHLFACVALALPAFQLMQAGGSSPQPPLHPVLSSLFRIVDGIRLTTHLMLFLSEERTRLPEEPTSAAEIHDFAERNGLFLATHGVCAGPKALIDQFLATVFGDRSVEGAAGVELAPEVRALLSRLPDAVDYGLLGAQSWAVTRSVLLLMSRAYKAMRELFETAGDAAICQRLREVLRRDRAELDRERVADDVDWMVHLTVYVDTYEQSWRALRSPVGPPTLAERIAPCPEGPQHLAAAARLREVLASRFAGTGLGGPGVERLVAILVRYLREEQGILRSATEIQDAINTILDRPRPTRPFTVRDLRAYLTMLGGDFGRFPYLFDLLEDELGVRAVCTADAIEMTDQWTGAAGSEARRSAGPSNARQCAR